MNPFRQIIEDGPEMIAIPPELRHQRLEVIIWPLERGEPVQDSTATRHGWPVGLF